MVFHRNMLCSASSIIGQAGTNAGKGSNFKTLKGPFWTILDRRTCRTVKRELSSSTRVESSRYSFTLQ